LTFFLSEDIILIMKTQKEKRKEYARTHREQIALKQKKWRLKNPEKTATHRKKYYETHKEERKKHDRKYYCNNRKRIQARQKKYYKKNEEYVRLYQIQRRRKYPENALLRHAKERAKQYGFLFTITKNDIVVPKFCPLLEIPIFIGNNGLCDNSPTLDRIENKGGYTKDNIQVISHKANRMKSNSTFEEFQIIYHNWKKQKKEGRK